MAVALRTPGLWSAEDTTPGEIEGALLRLMHERWSDGMVQAPARVLNLVVVVEADRRAEVAERLERLGGGNPARTIVVAVEPGRQLLAARASLVHGTPGALGGETVFREHIELTCGETAIPHLSTIIFPVLASEVATVVWAPHGHGDAVDALLELTECVLLDSLDFADWNAAVARIRELADRVEVCDLAWLRSTPWRERIAATFDPLIWRGELAQISRVSVRMHPDSTMSALLLVGWLAARLGWNVDQLDCSAAGRKSCSARSEQGPIELSFEDDQSMPVPGLAGLTIESSSGMQLSLNRGSGGLRAERTLPGGATHGWTMIGASRGEDGILATGVAHALLPDELFRPALECACAFGGCA